MTDHRPANDDLLSAYIDGETTPAERAEVERRLHASADARRELNEIGEVSQLIRSLPHERLPRDFAAQVLARAEREMLLAAPAAPESIAPTSPRRRARWFALGSLVATAALVLVVTSLIGPPHDGDEVAGRGSRDAANQRPDAIALRERGGDLPKIAGRADPGAGAPVPAGDVGELDREPREESSARFSSPAAPRAMPEEPGAAADAPFPGAAPTASADEAAAGRGVLATDENELQRRRSRPLRDLDGSEPAAGARQNLANAPDDVELANVRAGDIVRYAEQSDEGVAVVELTVVDVREAAGAMQVLLVRNGGENESLVQSQKKQAALQDKPAVTLRQAEAAPVERAPAGSAADRRQGELLAIYVESTDERLASALEEMQRRGLLERPQLRPSVDPERVEVAELEAAPADQSAAASEREDARDMRRTLAAVVAQNKARLGTGGDIRALRQSEAGRAPLRDRNQTADAVTPSRPARIESKEREQRAGEPGAARPPELAEALTGADTFQLLFRPNEKSLEGPSDVREGARRFITPERQRSFTRGSRPAAARSGQYGVARGGRADAPLRVIFLFRQTP